MSSTRASLVICCAMAFMSTAVAQQGELKVCIDAVRKDASNAPDSDPKVSAGIRCCQQIEIARQDLEIATSMELSWGRCVVLFNEGKQAEGRACVEQLRPKNPATPKVVFPPATAEIAAGGYEESQARRGQMASEMALRQSQKCSASQ